MGILKHFVLPAFGLVHAASLVACQDLASWGKLVGITKEEEALIIANDTKSSSIRQRHMLGTVRGFNAAMLALCGWCVFSPKCHSDTRQAIAMAETALFTVVTVDAFRLGGDLNFLVPMAHALLALGGSIVSFMEPGIFTTDHSK